MLERPLRRVSALGTIVASASLRVVEEILPAIVSVRTSRRGIPDLGGLLREVKLEPPKAPLDVAGDATWSCAWLEPHAWLLLGTLPAPMRAATPDMLIADVSHRFASFRISGPRAEELLAAAVSVWPDALAPGRCVRTRFAEEAEVTIQRFADEYRLLIDVSLGPFAADWLRDATALLLA